jgi:hypothetical protein
VDERTGDWLGVFILQQDENKRSDSTLDRRARPASDYERTTVFRSKLELIRGVSYETAEAGLDWQCQDLEPERYARLPNQKLKRPSDFPEGLDQTDRPWSEWSMELLELGRHYFRNDTRRNSTEWSRAARRRKIDLRPRSNGISGSPFHLPV